MHGLQRGTVLVNRDEVASLDQDHLFTWKGTDEPSNGGARLNDKRANHLFIHSVINSFAFQNALKMYAGMSTAEITSWYLVRGVHDR